MLHNLARRMCCLLILFVAVAGGLTVSAQQVFGKEPYNERKVVYVVVVKTG